jgi:hypothetical protein
LVFLLNVVQLLASDHHLDGIDENS